MSESTPCAHYSLEVETIVVPTTGVEIHIPVRRCALSERLVVVFQRSDAAADLRSYMLLAAPAGAGPAEIRVALGPDLEPIERRECTVERCRESCTPGYRDLLAHYALTDPADLSEQDCIPLIP